MKKSLVALIALNLTLSTSIALAANVDPACLSSSGWGYSESSSCGGSTCNCLTCNIPGSPVYCNVSNGFSPNCGAYTQISGTFVPYSSNQLACAASYAVVVGGYSDDQVTGEGAYMNPSTSIPTAYAKSSADSCAQAPGNWSGNGSTFTCNDSSSLICNASNPSMIVMTYGSTSYTCTGINGVSIGQTTPQEYCMLCRAQVAGSGSGGGNSSNSNGSGSPNLNPFGI